MTSTPHVDDRLDDWLDERLSPADRIAVDHHLLACESCRAVRDGLLTTRRVLRDSTASAAVAEGLEARIRSALDREDEAAAAPRAVKSPSETGPIRPLRRRWAWALAAAAVVAAAVGLALQLAPWVQHPLDDAFAQYTALEAGTEALPDLAVASPGDLLGRWQRAELGFEARVLDLGAMGIALAGGGARRLGDRKAALAVYTGEARPLVACWMFLGAEARLPAAVEEHRERGFRFRVYQRGGVTLVVWREGDVLCALASRGPRREVLALAVGKAMAREAA